MGQVARENRFVTISECGPLTNDVKLDVKHCHTLSEASVASPFMTKGIPANDTDALGDGSGEPVESRDSFALVHPEDKFQDVQNAKKSWSVLWNH